MFQTRVSACSKAVATSESILTSSALGGRSAFLHQFSENVCGAGPPTMAHLRRPFQGGSVNQIASSIPSLIEQAFADLGEPSFADGMRFPRAPQGDLRRGTVGGTRDEAEFTGVTPRR